jgi:hypothetical protein
MQADWGGDYENLRGFFQKLVSHIMFHDLMPINRMVLLNANTVILLKWVLLFLRMHPCLMTLSKVPPCIGTPSAVL